MHYPTRSGLIIPVYEIGFTLPTEEQLARRCTTTNHHGYFPGRDYETTWRRVFRNLTVNMYPMLAKEHNMASGNLHDRFDPPKMPRDGMMIEVVDEILVANGIIECVHSRDTSQTYQVTPEQWASYKEHYRRA